MLLGGFVHILRSQIEQLQDELIRGLRFDLKLPEIEIAGESGADGT